MTVSITARSISFAAGHVQLLEGIDLDAVAGQLVGLIGPNGSGKTTLLRLLAGLRTPLAGTVTLDGSDIRGMRRGDVARRLAIVEQDTSAHTDLTVRQVVEIGRTPFRGRFDALSEDDERIIAASLERVDLVAMANRPWHSLSGGEKQRAQLARALAQQPREILLDEPTNHLDIRHQIELLELLRSIDATCVIALHDLNLAARYCDHLVVLDDGRVVAAGRPERVLTATLLARVYEVDGTVDREADSGAVRISIRGVRKPAD